MRLSGANPGNSNGVTLAPSLVKVIRWNWCGASEEADGAELDEDVDCGSPSVRMMVSLKPLKKAPGCDAGISTCLIPPQNKKTIFGARDSNRRKKRNKKGGSKQGYCVRFVSTTEWKLHFLGFLTSRSKLENISACAFACATCKFRLGWT